MRRAQQLPKEEEPFPKRLFSWRLRRGFTQEQLGKRAGLHWMTISRLERGKTRPFIRTIQSLCEALDLEPNQLVTETEYAEAHKKKGR